MSNNQVIPEAAVEAAVSAVEQETYGADWARRIATIAVKAAAPHMASECDGSSSCASIGHIEGCFSTNPDYAK